MKKYLVTLILLFGITPYLTTGWNPERYDDDFPFFGFLEEKPTEKPVETSKETQPLPRVSVPDVPETEQLSGPSKDIFLKNQIDKYMKGAPLTPPFKKYMEIELLRHQEGKPLSPHLEKYVQEKILHIETYLKKLKMLVAPQSKKEPKNKKVAS